MMTVEQYSNQEFSELYQQRFVEMMFKYHEELFKKLIKLGMIQDEDPKTLAEIYGSPIYVHIGNCDRKTETEQECLKALEKHVRLFQRENNMSKAIVYTSNTGYTKEYAEMLILEFKQPLYELNNARKNLNIGDKVVYLGWVMADMVQGYKEAGEYFCINLLCAVGLSLNGTKIDKIKEANQIDDFTPLFTLHGGLDLKKFKGVKKLIMKMISKSMLRELLNKNDISDDDRKLISILQDGESGVSTNNLRDAVKYYYENCI